MLGWESACYGSLRGVFAPPRPGALSEGKGVGADARVEELDLESPIRDRLRSWLLTEGHGARHDQGLDQTRLISTSTLPRMALEYGHD